LTRREGPRDGPKSSLWRSLGRPRLHRPTSPTLISEESDAEALSPIRIAVLASSSSGNATLVDTGEGAFLVDAGLSARELERRLSEDGAIRARDLSALVLTHEHSDHVRGVQVLARRHGLPVLATAGTLRGARGVLGGLKVGPRRLNEAFELAGASVSLLRVPHDALEPAAVLVESRGARALIATDLGHVPPSLMDAAMGAEVLLLESNHDVRMLREGPYPEFLKSRIAGPTGHLSNAQCAEALRSLVGPRTRAVLLGHLSQRNNTEELALMSARFGLTLGSSSAPVLRATSPHRVESFKL
jgi:phosphoribosyl 1,2-cyclic phosphodiesterase